MKFIRWFICIAFLFGGASWAQAPYGNEWIKPGQKYVKFRIAKTGLYKITYQDLQNAGLNTLDFISMKAEFIRLWSQGNEVPLWVSAPNGKSLGTSDFLMFYGRMNNGASDSLLYKNPSMQPHTLSSLYTDTAAYYLTWNNADLGLRATFYSDTVYVGKTPEPYYLHTEHQIFGGFYWDGESIPGLDDLRFSDYTTGEGYMSWRYNKRQAFPYSFTISRPYTSGPPLQSYVQIFGRSNALSSIGSPFKHHLQCSVKTAGTAWWKTHDTLFDAFGNPKIFQTLPFSWLGNDTVISSNLFIPDSLKLLVDFQNFSNAWIQYPRRFSMLGQNNWTFTLDPSAQSRYLEIQDVGTNNPIIWDVASGSYLQGIMVGNVLRVNIPPSSKAVELLISDSLNLRSPIVAGERVSFTSIDTTTPWTFLIITNKKLAKSAEDYRKYRESTKQKTLVVYAEDLYEQFYYGIGHHPMALRNFCRYMIDHGAVKPQYLLLLGKGVQLDKFKTIDNVTGKFAYYESDLVPTWGYPASDILITAGLNGTQWEPAMATGRLAAKNDDQVTAYLSKLRIHENSSALVTPWRKNILHLTGGRSVGETDVYKSYLENLRKIAESDSFGGSVKRYAKYESLPVTSSQKELIHDDLRNGVAFTYYYGHGAASLLEVDIGEPDEANNSGKNPIMFFAGCIIGNCYSSTDETTLGERWVFGTKTNGAIAWIGNTWYGYTGDLYQYAYSTYENLFRKNYGKPIGDVQIAAIKELQTQGGAMTEAHIKQIVIQGDPALKMYSPPNPDYAVTRSTISVYPDNTIASVDSFALKIALMNYGNTGADSVKVHVIHTLPNKLIRKLDTLMFPAPKFVDTVYYWIQQKGLDTKGTNAFRVEVNPPGPGRIREMNYLNDTATYYYFMPTNGADIVFPYPYAIVGQQNPDLVAQGLTSLTSDETFIFEIDTNPYFNSPWRKNARVLAKTLANCKAFTLLSQDTMAYFWRVKLDRDPDKGGIWKTSSFTYIKDGGNGWAQVSFPQMTGSDFTQIFLDTLDRTMEFRSRTSTTFSMFSVGASYHPTPFWRQASRVFRRGGGALGPGIADGFGIVVINPADESLYNLIQHPYNDFIQQTINGKRVRTYYGIYKFNTRIDSVRDDLRNFIDSIPDGYRVYVIKGDNPGFSRWSFQDYQAFVKIGGKSGFLQNKVKETYPYTLKGTKGQNGKGREQTADETNFIISPDAQLLQEYDQVGPRFTEGYISSERVGPSKGWETFYKKVTGLDNPKEGYTYDIIPIDTNGFEYNGFHQYKFLFADTFDLRSIDAARFPWLKVQFNFKDDSMRTMQNLNYWMIHYKGVPEGSIAYGTALNSWWKMPKDTLEEGEVTQLHAGFHNISNYPFDSLLVKVEVSNERGTIILDSSRLLGPLKPGDTVFVKYNIPSKNFFGVNQYTLTFNPGYHQPEQYLYNNVITGKFYAKPDRINPLLDVTFDGKHITDGSMVSANPLIRIEANDENRNFPIDDTSRMEVWFTRPNKSTERVYWTDPRITFYPAAAGQTKAYADFSPGPLEDGTFTLQAQVMDVAGNKSGAVPYSIRFVVNNKPGMTRFYPYPNPFSTRARFVFTLTGQQVPEQIRIRIMTANGIVVREIFEDELGAIRIGDNISDFAWDGRDQYGDLLGNGVYFYTVTARVNGKEIDLIKGEQDEEYFKKGIGKIVIMR